MKRGALAFATRSPLLLANINAPHWDEEHIGAPTIAMLNMRGGMVRNTTLIQKWSLISKMIYKHRIAVLALQETHLDREKTRQIWECFSKNLEIVTSEDPDDPTGKAGVAFVINKTVLNPKELMTKELLPGWALFLKIKWLESRKTTLLNVYIPTTRAAQKPFWETVDAKRREGRTPCPEFVLGDFNVTEDKIDRAPAHLDNRTATEALRKIRLEWEIQDAWRHAHPNERCFTYRAGNGEQ